jgi:hypothetical protein
VIETRSIATTSQVQFNLPASEIAHPTHYLKYPKYPMDTVQLILPFSKFKLEKNRGGYPL